MECTTFVDIKSSFQEKRKLFEVEEWINVVLRKGVKGLADEFLAIHSRTKPSAEDYTTSTGSRNFGKNT